MACLAAAFALGVGCMTPGDGAQPGGPVPPPVAAQSKPADAKSPPAKPPAAKPTDGKTATAASAPGRPAFSHKFHLSRGVSCGDCHEDTEKKDEAAMPSVEFCMDCHEEIDAEKKANRVEDFLDKPGGKPVWSHVTAQAATISFSHKVHLAKKAECADCHSGIEESDAVSRELFTDMDACTACHTAKGAKNECGTCHTDMGPGWMPPSHQRSWIAMHGQEVRRGAGKGRLDDCTLCHTDTSCRSCHSTELPRDHTQSWRAGGGHGLAASLDRERCSSCHQSDSCNDCHSNLRPRSHRGSWGSPRNAHCNGCHVPVAAQTEDGCGVCHRGTPSHASAPRMPQNPPHSPSMQCRQCHDGRPNLRHADNGANCLSCHR